MDYPQEYNVERIKLQSMNTTWLFIRNLKHSKVNNIVKEYKCNVVKPERKGNKLRIKNSDKGKRNGMGSARDTRGSSKIMFYFQTRGIRVSVVFVFLIIYTYRFFCTYLMLIKVILKEI